MKDGSGLLLQDGCGINGEGNGYQLNRYRYSLAGCVVRQQYFELFFAAVAEGGILLAFFVGQLLAQVTFAVTGRIGIVAVFAEGSCDRFLIEGKSNDQPAFAEGLCQYQHQEQYGPELFQLEISAKVQKKKNTEYRI
jgi:hypothetical protein